ncbi:MAG: hypothetical protein JSR73_04360 [Proteobacteria bacterium]|nr:hypothetical protein [Pseudomonadota bacterium]
MSRPPPLDEQFRMIRDSEVFEYLDKTPSRQQVGEYAQLSERYGIPILAGGWWYTLGRDEAQLEDNLRIGATLGSLVHNVQIMMDHADGRLVTDAEVVEAYLRAYDIGAALGCLPAFEVHINMWSEDFRRVAEVACQVESRGIPFRLTLDHSHVIFKIGNERELAVFELDSAVAAGELVLDPFAPGSICARWIEAGWVAHSHARSTVPNNPRNVWARHASLAALPSSRHPRDLVGRGVQYPFVAPGEGEWHSAWHGNALEPWKEVMRQLVTYHRGHESSPLRLISTEFIPYPDYGEGAGYSLFANSLACARWIRVLLDHPAAAAAHAAA